MIYLPERAFLMLQKERGKKDLQDANERRENVRNPSFAYSHANSHKASHVDLSWKTDFQAIITSQI